MASVTTVWGIDVGRCAVKAIKLRQSADGKIELVGHDYIEHATILSQPDADRHELIGAALEKFLSRNDISKDQVVVSVPGQHALARFTKLPPVAPKRIPDIVRYEADQQIPFDMDEVIWDYQTFQQEDLPDIEVGIFAMKRELLREHLLHFEQAGIEPIAVQPSPLALYNAARFDERLGEETTILLDMGAENTDLVIATPHSLWTRTIPIGGNRFTDALVKSFKLSFAKAENLKRTAETSKYRRQIFQAMRPTFADIVQELQRSIGFYSSTHRDATIDRIVGFGDAFQLPGLQKYFQQNLGLSVEKPDSFAKVATTGTPSEAFKEHFLSFAVAYGLALQGLDQGQVTSNLLPTEIARQVVWRRKRPAFAAAAACLLLAGGITWFRHTTDMRALASGSGSMPNLNVSQAASVIDNGPQSGLPPGERAKTILAAGRALQSELGKLSNEGKQERQQTLDLLELQRQKKVIPRIVEIIHESLPKAQQSIADAASTKDVQEALQSAGKARADREEVFIESLDIRYLSDLNVYIWQSRTDVEPPINDPSTVVPGLKIDLFCTTPNAGGAKFIDEQFLDVLRANGRRPGRGFYFDRVYLIDGFKVEPGSGPGKKPTGAGTAGGRGGRSGWTVTPQSTEDNPASYDVVTNELITNDWRFEIWLDVILEDFPEAEAEGDAGNGG